MPVEIVLKKNTAFKDAPQMQQVRDRIEHFLSISGQQPEPIHDTNQEPLTPDPS
jgi:hypothetical protein